MSKIFDMLYHLINCAGKFIRAGLPVLAAVMAVSIAGVPQVKSAASKWQDLGGGKARLVAVLDPATNIVSGAVEIVLKPGWKTYWRNPGSSGIPPEFDFSGSTGFLAGEVKFPTPSLQETAGSIYAGYSEKVAFPFEGQLLTSTGANISLSLFIGVCEEICIPATAAFDLPADQLMNSDPEAASLISSAVLSLPVKSNGEPVILDVSSSGEQTLSIKVRLDDVKNEIPSLFVEGPQGWYLTPARFVSQSPKSALFELDVSDIPDGAKPLETKLRYTLVNGKTGIEIER